VQVLADVAAFAKFDRNGLDLEIEFSSPKNLSAKTRKFMLTLAKAQMEQVVDSSGYGWDDEDREEELKEEASRYLLVRRREDRALVGFADFRFTLQGDIEQKMEGFPSLLVNDLQLAPEVQRKGLGRHLAMTLEMIARKQKMTFMQLKVFKGCDAGEGFVSTKLKGFAPDSTWVSPSEPIRMLQKLLNPADLKSAGVEAPSASDQAVSPPTSPPDAVSATATGAAAASTAPKQAKPLELDSQFAAAIKLTPAAPKAPDPAEVLELFYRTIGEEKSTAQISDIIEKRRRSSKAWFENLCGKLEKKYKQNPMAMWEEKQAAEQAEQNATEAEAEDNGEDVELSPEQARATAIAELSKVFSEQHGRAPTEEEIGRWTESFDRAVAGAKQQPGAVGEEDENGNDLSLPSFGAEQK
jgi:GNAT superfamily N-acetyltransferase